MELLLPQSFINNVIQLISNQLPFFGRTQASIMAGVTSEIGSFLKSRSEFSITTTELDTEYRNGRGAEIEQKLNYAMASFPLYQEYLFLEKYSELTSKNLMNIETICDFFMKRIYKMTLLSGYSEALDSSDFKEYFTLPSDQKVQNIFSILKKTELIEVITELEDGSYVFTLSGLGEHHVEKGGKTGILKAYLNKEGFTIMDKRVFITNANGNVQVNVDSPNSTQNISISNNDELFIVLNKMIDILKLDTEMNPEEKEDAVLNIESIKTELKKSKPKLEYLRDYLAIAANTIKVKEFVLPISTFLISKYPEIEQYIASLFK